MLVREFTAADKDTFISLCEEFYSCGATMHRYNEKTAVKTFARVIDKHENLWGLLLTDSQTSQPIGYALITAYWCNEEGGNVLVLDELYIAPVNRHKGYASIFMEWLENRYRDVAVAITLEVLTSNVKACGLYTKEGYSPDGFTTYTKRILADTE